MASVDTELRDVRERLEELGEPTSMPSLTDARRRFAETESILEAERERVATLRGRLQQAGQDDPDVVEAYRTAVRELSEAETEHAAARESLEGIRLRARIARDEREQRLRLKDRIANLERRARAELVAAIHPDVERTVQSVPGSRATTFDEATPVTAALALIRVGVVRSPVVLACRRFPDASSAESWLRAPVYRL